MRLWSISPKYLDAKGLVALWRESLLAKHVLNGQTRGYKNHPQLERFKSHTEPLVAIDTYLSFIQREAQERGYKFDSTKIGITKPEMKILVTTGQILYEMEHLKRKLIIRDPERFELIKEIITPEITPIFDIVEGDIEKWEIITN